MLHGHAPRSNAGTFIHFLTDDQFGEDRKNASGNDPHAEIDTWRANSNVSAGETSPYMVITIETIFHITPIYSQFSRSENTQMFT
jgi:hypothetical protein